MNDFNSKLNALQKRVLGSKPADQGNETVTNCHQLKMEASDGKMRKADCANAEQLLRIQERL